MSQTPPPTGPTSPPPAGERGPTTPDQGTDVGVHHDDPLRSSRTSGAWTAVLLAAVLLVLLVIFVVQNTERTPIEFLWLDGRFPLAAALLIATAAGMAIVAAVGSLRILQLRRRVKREQRLGRG